MSSLKKYWVELATVMSIIGLTAGNLYFYGEKNLALTLEHAVEIGSMFK